MSVTDFLKNINPILGIRLSVALKVRLGYTLQVRAFLLLLTFAPALHAAVVPLERAHSHNDYEHGRPLLDALERGFCSVEADVHIVDGKLLVGHTRGDTSPERTLEALYLDPLLAQVRQNGGRVYPGGPGFTLLVEAKGDKDETYFALRALLPRYREMLTVYRKDSFKAGAVSVIITGHKNNDLLAAEPVRYAAIDGDAGDDDSGDPVSLIPLVSVNWKTFSSWRGGRLSDMDRARLERIIRRVHQRGRRIRFYAAPDTEESYSLLYKAGADLLNTDDLDGLQRFLLSRPHQRRLPTGRLSGITDLLVPLRTRWPQ